MDEIAKNLPPQTIERFKELIDAAFFSAKEFSYSDQEHTNRILDAFEEVQKYVCSFAHQKIQNDLEKQFSEVAGFGYLNINQHFTTATSILFFIEDTNSFVTVADVLQTARAEIKETKRRPTAGDTDRISFEPIARHNISWSAINGRIRTQKYNPWPMTAYLTLADLFDKNDIKKSQAPFTIADVLQAALAETKAKDRRPATEDEDKDPIAFEPMIKHKISWKAIHERIRQKSAPFTKGEYTSLKDLLNKNSIKKIIKRLKAPFTIADVLQAARAETKKTSRRPTANNKKIIFFSPMVQYRISWANINDRIRNKTSPFENTKYTSLANLLNENNITAASIKDASPPVP